MNELTTEQLEQRLRMVESMMATCHRKDLPYLNQTYQRIMDELVRRDLMEADDAHTRTGTGNLEPTGHSEQHRPRNERRGKKGSR